MSLVDDSKHSNEKTYPCQCANGLGGMTRKMMFCDDGFQSAEISLFVDMSWLTGTLVYAQFF